MDRGEPESIEGEERRTGTTDDQWATGSSADGSAQDKETEGQPDQGPLRHARRHAEQAAVPSRGAVRASAKGTRRCEDAASL